VYFDINDITVVHTDKKNLNEGTDLKEIMRSIFGNDIAFLDPNTFL
jgi:hypothetical protein